MSPPLAGLSVRDREYLDDYDEEDDEEEEGRQRTASAAVRDHRGVAVGVLRVSEGHPLSRMQWRGSVVQDRAGLVMDKRISFLWMMEVDGPSVLGLHWQAWRKTVSEADRWVGHARGHVKTSLLS